MQFNEAQIQAIQHNTGPCMVIAGPGAGKTTVLTHRVRYLIERYGVNPSDILVITFTKAAAEQMKLKFKGLSEGRNSAVTFGTFHAVFFTILKAAYNYSAHCIIKPQIQHEFVKDQMCRLELEFDDENEAVAGVLSEISCVKGEDVNIDEYESRCIPQQSFRIMYRAYDDMLVRKHLIDFDDMIVQCRELLMQREDYRRAWQNKYKYILIDEFQDINKAQFDVVRILADEYRNLFVVGDDDQSIYRFRGANIRNILGFERVFPDAKVIRLEQNYRSTQNILNAANGVIANNTERKEKTLWTENPEGEKIHFRQFMNGYVEAEFVVGDIARRHREGTAEYHNCAVLYRTNAQSRLFEEKCLLANIPYKIVGGVNFYARKEIKDLLCYLKTVDNAADDLAVRRILNVPKRGIGATTVGRIQDYADMMNISFYDALRVAEEVPSIGRSLAKVDGFVTFIQSLKSKAQAYSVSELLEEIIDLTGNVDELKEEDNEESRARVENIDELISKTVSYEETMKAENREATLSGFLEEIALIADIDSVDENQDYVVLMTLHSAKGLEFPYVYLAGMEDGMFPSSMCIFSGDQSELEEERRLCYVGITRAMKELTMTSAQQRMVRGETQYNRVSRFVREIPRELVDLGHTVQEHKPKIPETKSPLNSYLQMKKSFHTKAFQPQNFKVTKADSLDYGVGDTVRHIKFGVGIVKDIVEGGRDYEVTVDFDKVGVKKMFAAFAKLKKI